MNNEEHTQPAKVQTPSHKTATPAQDRPTTPPPSGVEQSLQQRRLSSSPTELEVTAMMNSQGLAAPSNRARPVSLGVNWYEMEKVSPVKPSSKSLPPISPTGQFPPSWGATPSPSASRQPTPTPSVTESAPPAFLQSPPVSIAKWSRSQQGGKPSLNRPQPYAPSMAASTRYAPSMAPSTQYHRSFNDPEYQSYPRTHMEDPFVYEYQRGEASGTFHSCSCKWGRSC